MDKVPVYQVLAEDIRALGVDAVFGLMSDDTAVLVVTLDTIGVRFHGARHENGAIAMAEGYAAASGQLGVAVIGRGPAAANGLHAATYASRTGSPVLIIYGEASVADGAVNIHGPDYKRFDAVGVLSAAGLRTFVATSAGAARRALADAVASAWTGTAAALLLPTNVQLAEIPAAPLDSPLATAQSAPQPLEPRPHAIDAAIALLERSRRPLIIAGAGAHRANAREALEHLARRIGAVLITSARGKDMFRDNPFNLGIIGSFSHSAARRMTDQIDCALVFGAGLNFLTTSFGEFVPPVPLIQVDTVRAHIGQWCDADVAVVGDARLVAEQMLEVLPGRPDSDKPFHTEETRRTLAAFDISQDFQAANTAHTVDPRSLGITLDKLLPANRNLVYDSGNFLGIVPYISVPGPDHFKLTSDFASVGLGFGVALGFARARPDATTVLVIGDGGFIMSMGELETVIREDLPLLIVVMNDCAYGAELHVLRMRQLPVAMSVFRISTSRRSPRPSASKRRPSARSTISKTWHRYWRARANRSCSTAKSTLPSPPPSWVSSPLSRTGTKDSASYI
jgi:thiamine pyrophosphate-dependent acetolactate synthase large subunit-like protein